MNNKWQYGPADSMWMEENPPSRYTWAFMFDMDDYSTPTRNVLTLLDKLNVLDFGCFYETIEQVRLRR
jgi:hypothetical protein